MGTRARAAARLIWLVLVAATATQCNCPGRVLPPLDAGPTDSGPRDAGPDAARDAGRDAGRRDAGVAEWIRLEGVPDTCGVFMAADPGRVHPPLRFEPCADRASCRQLVLDWDANPRGARFVANTDTGYHDGDRGVFVFRRPTPTARDENAWWSLIASDAGEVLALFEHRFPESAGCYLMRIAVGEGRFAVEVASGIGESWIVGGELAAPVTTVQRVAHFDGDELGGGYINVLRVGAAQIAVETTEYAVFRLGWDGTLRRLDTADANYPSVVGSAIVADSAQATNQVLVSDSGATPVALVPPPEVGAEPSAHVRTDGRTLAWLVGFNRTGMSGLFFERVELWASAFATRSEDLRPMRMATMRNVGIHNAVVGGHGHAAVIDDEASLIRFFRASDAHETALTAPAGLEWSGWVGFIGPREILVSAGTSAAFTGQTAVQFIDYTALEPAL